MHGKFSSPDRKKMGFLYSENIYMTKITKAGSDQ